MTPNAAMASMSPMEEKEWVAVSPEALARGLAEQTAGGWMAAHVYERDRQTNTDE
jgi:hypothetical protein